MHMQVWWTLVYILNRTVVRAGGAQTQPMPQVAANTGSQTTGSDGNPHVQITGQRAIRHVRLCHERLYVEQPPPTDCAADK